MFLHIKGKHINGRKELSLGKAIMELTNPDFVYFPITLDNAKYNLKVNVGDQVLMGEPIMERDGRFNHLVCSSVSGKVNAIKKMWHSSGKMVEMLEIENDHNDSPYYKKPESLDITKEEFVKKISDAGIVGLGGAGFPTFVKYIPDTPVDYIIVNAAECEPYITCDYMTIIEEASKLIRGLNYVVSLNKAKEGVICIKKTKKPAIEALEKALSESNIKNIRVQLINDVYPAGWEKYLVEQVANKTYNGLPRDAGCIIDNVQTFTAICDVMEENKPLIERVVTVSGEAIKNPGNFRVRIGTKVSSLIEKCDGYIDGLGDAYFIAGGPMTGRPIVFDEVIITPTVGSILVKPKPAKIESNNCIGCGKCAENCPAYLTPTMIKQAFTNGNSGLLEKLNVNKCVQCGMCSYVCPSRIEMTDYVGKAKAFYQKAQATKQKKNSK